MNGPTPRMVSNMATAETKKLESAAPVIEKRTAPQMMNGNTVKLKTAPVTAPLRNSNSQQVRRDAIRNASSARRGLLNLNSAKLSTRGTINNRPIISPNHHIKHVDGQLLQERQPVETTTSGPVTALMAVPKEP